MKRATREWVQKAEDDFRTAELLVAANEPFHDQVCFHCQQSSEKYLKALLEEKGLHIAKTHDLCSLQLALLAHHPQLRPLRRGLLFLTDFAVDMRYPGNDASKRQATAAQRWASRVRETSRKLLKLRSRRA